MTTKYEETMKKTIVRLVLLGVVVSLLVPHKVGAFFLPPPGGSLCWYKADVMDDGTACNCLMISSGQCSYAMYSFTATCNCGTVSCGFTGNWMDQHAGLVVYINGGTCGGAACRGGTLDGPYVYTSWETADGLCSSEGASGQ
jgi:hypothetical protein